MAIDEIHKLNQLHQCNHFLPFDQHPILDLLMMADKLIELFDQKEFGLIFLGIKGQKQLGKPYDHHDHTYELYHDF